MPLRRRGGIVSPFNLSFLDVMFCGFGAVVLLVLILNSQLVSKRREDSRGLRARVEQLKREVSVQQAYIAGIKQRLQVVHEKNRLAEEEVSEISRQLELESSKTKSTRRRAAVLRKRAERVAAELQGLDARERKAALARSRRAVAGRHALKFTGKGHRQYLTGLKLGGSRVLILLDSSASMLADTIVNIIRIRNMSDPVKKTAEKWRRAVKTVRWLVANLPLDSSVNITLFSDTVHPLKGGSSGWIPLRENDRLESMLSALVKTVPRGGTNLFKAFSHAASIRPRPDNIILLTDGLPTLGAGASSGSTVTSDERVRLFLKAASMLPAGVPVNIILFPLEGDPMAASMYWRLAVDSSGALFTPSRSWP